ncbi:MAG: DUF2989 domain-containing protein [Colwellia sp.]|nr:DUF2989 domain-containing protein [Colwellia sp.]
MKKFFLLLMPIILLTSCDSAPKLSEVCQNNKQLCQVFTEDSWCKTERKHVIMTSVKLNNSQQDIDKYNLLLAYEAYGKCVRFAKKIEHIKLKGKKSLRVENYLKSQVLIKTLSNQTQNSQHPSLLFYHWSRYLDQNALSNFLAMEGSGVLETPEGQFNLASYYIKVDDAKTLSLLFHALELYQEGDQINNEIFSSLATIFQGDNKVKQAYIWLKIYHLYSPEKESVTEKSLINFAKTHHLKQSLLDKVAEQTLANIERSTFKAPRF